MSFLEALELYTAVFFGDIDAVADYVNNGGDVNLRESSPLKTPLIMVAATSKEVGILEYLIEQGANVNAQDSMGRTALFLLDITCASTIVKLIEAGADPYITTNKGKHVLSSSLDRHQSDEYRNLILSALSNKSLVAEVNRKGWFVRKRKRVASL